MQLDRAAFSPSVMPYHPAADLFLGLGIRHRAQARDETERASDQRFLTRQLGARLRLARQAHWPLPVQGAPQMPPAPRQAQAGLRQQRSSQGAARSNLPAAFACALQALRSLLSPVAGLGRTAKPTGRQKPSQKGDRHAP